MLYLAGISIAFFLCFLLITKKEKTLSDKILSAWLFVVGVHLSMFYLYISENLFKYPFLLGIGLPIPLLHGPFLYLYVATLTGRIPVLRKHDLLHFLPALAAYTYLIQFFLLPAERKIYVFQNRGIGYETYIMISSAAISISGVVYVAWSFILLRKHRRSIMMQFSNTDKINLNWLRFLILGIAIIWIFVLLSLDTYVFGASVLFVMLIGYFGIKQVGIFTAGNKLLDDDDTPDDPNPDIPIPVYTENSTVSTEDKTEPRKKYSKSGLSDDAAETLHKNLLDLINSKKPFKESELTLINLAERLNTVPNYLSQIINEREGKNFYDYINTLRVEEFKKAIIEPGNEKFNFLGIAYDCGFNSKSSFNKYFKKITGLSPTEYLRQEIA